MAKKNTTKQRLLEMGLELFSERGYNNTGVQEVLNGVNVPKGCFYHHFKNKEDFGLQVIDYYESQSLAMMNAFFEGSDLSPLEKLHHFFKEGCERFRDPCQARGCLLGNMSQEMGILSPAFEASLEKKWRHTRDLFAQCISEAIAVGELSNDQDPAMLADFLLNGWQGALMRRKVAGSCEPLRTFMKIVFDRILPKAPAISNA